MSADGDDGGALGREPKIAYAGAVVTAALLVAGGYFSNTILLVLALILGASMSVYSWKKASG